MSALLDIREKLIDTQSAIARMEAELSANRNDEGLSLMLESLIKRQQSLEETFLEVAYREQLEVCSYRLIREHTDGFFPVAALGDTLKNFQTWLTTVFDAIRTGPKEKAAPSAEMVQRSMLRFRLYLRGFCWVRIYYP